MKREVIYRTDAMAAVGSLKGLSDTDKSKAMQAVLDVPAVQTCEDAVSRQHAIEALMRRDKELRNINWYDKPFAEGECKGIDYALEIVNALPSVQPTQSNASNALKTLDCIDRQEAIKTLEKGLPSEPLKSKYTEGITVGFGLAITWIEQLPAVQSQPIVRCKDCRFQDKGRNESESWNLCRYRPWLHVPTEDEHYCGYAERRIDEQTD